MRIDGHVHIVGNGSGGTGCWIRTPAWRWPLQALIHGSDFPVPVFGHWAWMRGLVDWATLQRWQAHRNVIERDYQLKRAMGYNEGTFTRLADLLPPAIIQKRNAALKINAGDERSAEPAASA